MDVARMAIDNNRALAGVFWPDLPLGRLAVGAAADVIFVDYHPITPLTAGNLPWHLTVSYTHLRAHETVLDLVCRLLLEKKKYNDAPVHIF